MAQNIQTYSTGSKSFHVIPSTSTTLTTYYYRTDSQQYMQNSVIARPASNTEILVTKYDKANCFYYVQTIISSGTDVNYPERYTTINAWVKFSELSTTIISPSSTATTVNNSAATTSSSSSSNSSSSSSYTSSNTATAITRAAKTFYNRNKQYSTYLEYLLEQYGSDGTVNVDDYKYTENYYFSGTSSSSSNSSSVGSFVGIWGIPYQFSSTVDPRPNSNTIFGRYYTDRIIERMPILTLSPGKVAFMEDFKSTEKLAMFENLLNGGELASTIKEMIEGTGKYFTFEYDSASYWEYVNGAAHACAIYAGIGKESVTINGKTHQLRYFDWSEAVQDSLDGMIETDQEYVAFYTDAVTSKSEDFSNSTTESSLASTINGYSDTAKEAQFLMGDAVAEKVQSLLGSNVVEAAQETVSNIADKYLNGSTIFKDLSKEFSVIASGGKIMFPQIYSDSDFSQSFDVTIKLRCPNPDPLSWYLDILIPILHLIAFTMPRTPDGSVNGYSTPFLVRGFYKGIFNIDMGIITSLSISKGKDGSWTLDGYPTEVDVNLTIKDLYEVMAMSSSTNAADFLNNTNYLNYLANSVGVCINKTDLQRSTQLAWGLRTNAAAYNLFPTKKWWKHQKEAIQNKIISKYTSWFKG